MRMTTEVIGWITAAHGQRKCKPVRLRESRDQTTCNICLGVVRLAPVGPCGNRNVDIAEGCRLVLVWR